MKLAKLNIYVGIFTVLYFVFYAYGSYQMTQTNQFNYSLIMAVASPIPLLLAVAGVITGLILVFKNRYGNMTLQLVGVVLNACAIGLCFSVDQLIASFTT